MTETITELQNLPKNENGDFARFFETTNNRYKILSLQELSAKRITELQRMSIPFGMNLTFSKLYNLIEDLERHIYAIDIKDELTKTACLVSIMNMKQGIKETGKAEHHPLFYYCTVFIVLCDTEGRTLQDITTWNEEEAKEMVEDWNKHFYGYDFFFLAASMTPEFGSIYSKVLESLKRVISQDMISDIFQSHTKAI